MISEERERRLALLHKVRFRQAELGNQLAEQEILTWKRLEGVKLGFQLRPQLSPIFDRFQKPFQVEIQEQVLSTDNQESLGRSQQNIELKKIENFFDEIKENREGNIQIKELIQEKDLEISRLKKIIQKFGKEGKTKFYKKKVIRMSPEIKILQDKKQDLLNDIKNLKQQKLNLRRNTDNQSEQRIKELEKSVVQWKSKAFELTSKYFSALKTLKKQIRILKIDSLKFRSSQKQKFAQTKQDLLEEYSQLTALLGKKASILQYKKKGYKSKIRNK